MTAGELAEHFEVSKRTILRDVDTLTMAGIPVYTTQGKGGGISIHDKFVINKTLISENEQKQILFALQSISATQYLETESILRKLRSLFEKTDTDWIEVDFSRWGNGARDRAKFDSLKNAIINGQALSFTYHSSSGETTERNVYPLKLQFKSNAWYLQAFCLLKNDYRTFKTDRMRNVIALSDSFDGAAFQIPEIEPFEYQTTDLVEVKLQFIPQVAYRVYDEFNEKSIIKNEDGSLLTVMTLPNDYWLYDYILSFGAAVEVIEPKTVRDVIPQLAEKILKKYVDIT
jgi:predicted DNA-binding transcriptional regulator YafY